MAQAAAREFGSEPWPLAERWLWGPTVWPLPWCQAVQNRELDCGGLAHLAEIALVAAGNQVVRAELIERSAPDRTEHWAVRWSAVPNAPRWIWGDLTYHEAVGVLAGSKLRVWDPTEHGWRDSGSGNAGSKTLAIRLVPGETSAGPAFVEWSGRQLEMGSWAAL